MKRCDPRPAGARRALDASAAPTGSSLPIGSSLPTCSNEGPVDLPADEEDAPTRSAAATGSRYWNVVRRAPDSWTPSAIATTGPQQADPERIAGSPASSPVDDRANPQARGWVLALASAR